MNNNFGIYEKSFHLIIDAIRTYPEIEKVKIFGSRAMGNYKKGSDIDLAIFGEKINDRIVTRISSILNEELPTPYFIDVLDYKSISNKDLVEHINRIGIDFYIK